MFSWTFPLSLGCSCKETSGCRITLRQPKRGRDAASLEIPREICGTVGNPQHLYQLLLPLCLLLLHLLPPCLLQLFALSPAPLALRDEVDNPSWPHQGAGGVRCWGEGHWCPPERQCWGRCPSLGYQEHPISCTSLVAFLLPISSVPPLLFLAAKLSFPTPVWWQS